MRLTIKLILGTALTVSPLWLFADTVGDLVLPTATSRNASASDPPQRSGDSQVPVVPTSPQPEASPLQPPRLKPLEIPRGPLDASRAVPVQDCVVKFAEEVNVPATESGLISELSVAPGDAMQWGDSLARLDDRTLRIRRHAAELRLEAARQQSSDDLELRYAETALSETQAELDASRAIYDDAAGAVPLSTLRRLRLSVERAELEVARAKKAAHLAQVETELRAADLAEIDDSLRRLQLQSPLSGVVLQLFRQRGEWVAAGDPVVRVARLDRLEVHALLSADKLPPASCRDQVVAVIWTDPVTKGEKQLRGKVLTVQPQRVDGARYRIHAAVPNERTSDGKDWLLHPGTEVRMLVYPDSNSSLRGG